MKKGSGLAVIRFPLFLGLIPLLLLFSPQTGIPISQVNPGSNRVDTSISSILDSNLLRSNPIQSSDPLPEDSQWLRLGGPLGGLGYDIRMDPRNPDVMYVTDANAGAHKSLDGGKTWFPINEGIDMRTGPSGDIIPVFCLTIDPNNPDTIWIGLQGLGGIYRSNDGGMTWKRQNYGIDSDGLTVRGITIEPGNSEVIYVAGEIPSFRWAGRNLSGKGFDRTKGFVYKSQDGGLSWRKLWEGDNLARYIWVDPSDVNVLFVSTGIFDREASNTNAEENIPGGVGVLKSTDGGLTWRVLNEEVGLKGLYVGSLFMHPENPNILLAGAGHDYWSNAWDQGGKSFSPAGVWLTEDGGESWEKVLADDHLISSVEFCINNPDVAYAAGVFNFYHSSDGGHSWENIQPGENLTYGPLGIVVGFPIDLQCDPRNPQRIFVNNYGGGNFLSEDGGKTWSSASLGYTGAMMRKVIVDTKNPSLVFAGGRSGLFKSVDGGQSWEGLAYTPANKAEINAFAISPRDPNLVLNAPWDLLNMARSVDGGREWSVIPISDQSQYHQFLDLEFAPSDPNIVYASLGQMTCVMNPNSCTVPGDGIYISINAGETWKRVSDEKLNGFNTKTITVHPTKPKTVYAGTIGEGLYKTDDGGDSWQTLILDDQTIFALALNPDYPDHIMSAMLGGLRRSDDGGQTWEFSNAGLEPNARIRSIVFDPTNTERIWLSGLSSGVYLSTDSGHTWHTVNQGLANRSVNELAISSDGLTLYAATEGGGVFRLSTMSQADFNPPSPTPTPTLTTTSEPKPTKTQIILEPMAEPTKTQKEESVKEVEPTPDQPDSANPCLGTSILPLILVGALAYFRTSKQKYSYTRDD
jgi:photosystem II stability/assembly factor-like uncharacterized protein